MLFLKFSISVPRKPAARLKKPLESSDNGDKTTRTTEYDRIIGPLLVGEQILAARIHKGQTQKEAAQTIGCSYETIPGWEALEKIPAPSFFPGITEFIGFDPLPDPKSLREALVFARLRKGLSTEMASKLIGGSKSLWSDWERRGITRLSKKYIEPVRTHLGVNLVELKRRFDEMG